MHCNRARGAENVYEYLQLHSSNACATFNMYINSFNITPRQQERKKFKLMNMKVIQKNSKFKINITINDLWCKKRFLLSVWCLVFVFSDFRIYILVVRELIHARQCI